ncbi:hydroxymethylbilane synthase [Aliarcobacter thereius]|uniref:Porphobilinogen deaminase n=2 Tax=Aliarcobacter thereius TaxID=544718 RepID=A0A1C0B881_9BACT|nr:hydroxymethylbilane synthase [Aliarcobacter thereius]OCL93903.1 Porphobilinogen deaminase [Aliarcobacter thereius]OCL95305.1 Porphobilinogen deaminase [Aliarcobacter thereius LMG 24486]OCL99804.1 Porphobilinogen deaminase [Aliarcobacter thereius]QBF16706.1 hydroxymethylbilane synthase [Aliarcobacter thereius LMG 24486]TLS73168.1 hydroxymethylbilane synthase [Aliarcobacter thereius]
MQKLVIATRRSQLALWQSEYIKAELQKYYPDMIIELQEFVTKGDKILDVPLAKIGGKGLFTKELELAMLEGTAHLAVHSLKDVPTQFEDGLVLAAVSKRFNPQDALLSNKYKSLEELPKGAIIGTTSLRRRMALKILRPDIELKDLRGNINTRIAKLNAGEYDAIILAATGIEKLKLQDEVKYFSVIPSDIMIPSMGQATLGIETTDDPKIIEIVKVLNDKNAEIESKIERGFVDKLQGGCQVPIGVKATILDEKSVKIDAIVGLPDGSEYIKDSKIVDINSFESAGRDFADEFIKKGAVELLKRAEMMAFK